ncbi:zinc finger protein 816-like [Anopheles cruzii]|uniref:zinc finger protein 816-like n=1 Tax=Anopheles cruzii TaxID=68878 RepID=UPI0022EC67C5|nr:zinc finger protein 816-like [Anopheles cruzii]
MDREWICRLCLRNLDEDDDTSIYDKPFRAMLDSVFDFAFTGLEECAGVCRRAGAGCYWKVQEFYNFRKEVQSNQERLKGDYLAVRTAQLSDSASEEYSDYDDSVLVCELGDPLSSEAWPPSFTKDTENELLVEPEVCSSREDKEPDKEPISDSALKEPPEHDFTVTVCKEAAFAVEPDETLRYPLSNEASKDTENELPVEPEVCSSREDKEPDVRTSGEQSEKLHESDRTIRKFFKLCCELCPEDSVQDFGSFSQLTTHYRKTHGTRGYLRCCGKKFLRRFRVMEHIAHHQGAIRCDVCDKSFSSRSYMVVHKQTKHGSGAKSPPTNRAHRCEHCAEAFCSRAQLRVHMFKHQTKACPVCKKTFSASYIKKHITEMHGERQMLICDVCGKKMRTKLAMKRHIMLHAGIDTLEKVQCSYCAKFVQGKHNLKQHIRHMHLEEGQVFRCDVCQHESPNSKALQYHKRRVHVGKNFACEQCGKCFKQKIYLTEHLASHSARRLYACDICEATFNSKANYYKHRKSRHASAMAMKEQQ